MRLVKIFSAAVVTLSLSACGKTASTTANQTTASAANAVANPSTSGKTLTLTWDARTGTPADSYHIYGSTSSGGAESQIAVVSTSTDGFNPASPSVTLNSTLPTIAPFVGNTLCLTISAVVAGIESGYSNIVCQSL